MADLSLIQIWLLSLWWCFSRKHDGKNWNGNWNHFHSKFLWYCTTDLWKCMCFSNFITLFIVGEAYISWLTYWHSKFGQLKVRHSILTCTKVKRTMDVLQMRQPKCLLNYLPLIRDRKCQLLRTIKHHWKLSGLAYITVQPIKNKQSKISTKQQQVPQERT